MYFTFFLFFFFNAKTHVLFHRRRWTTAITGQPLHTPVWALHLEWHMQQGLPVSPVSPPPQTSLRLAAQGFGWLARLLRHRQRRHWEALLCFGSAWSLWGNFIWRGGWEQFLWCNILIFLGYLCLYPCLFGCIPFSQLSANAAWHGTSHQKRPWSRSDGNLLKVFFLQKKVDVNDCKWFLLVLKLSGMAMAVYSEIIWNGNGRFS